MGSLLNEDAFVQRMDKLTVTQESIESTSSWVSLWRKEATTVVSWWQAYYNTAPTKKKLSLLYLANDVVQTSRQKGPEFVNNFLRVLPKAVARFNREADESGKRSVGKLVDVWKQRQVFGRATEKFSSMVEDASKQISQENRRSTRNGQKSEHGRQRDGSEDAMRGKRQKRLPKGIDTLVSLVEDAEEFHRKRIAKEVSYDQSSGPHEEILQAYKQALKDEMNKRSAIIEYLEKLLGEEQSKYNGALGSLSVLPVAPESEAEVQAEGDQNDGEKHVDDEASKIAAQLMNDPAALLELLGSVPKKDDGVPKPS